MSTITHLYAGVPVSDLERGIDWYSRFFGRESDFRAGEEILWKIDERAWLFIEPNPDAAGTGRITLSVTGLDALLERLDASGIAHEPVETYASGVRHSKIPDPDGNAIAFAEPPDGADGSPALDPPTVAGVTIEPFSRAHLERFVQLVAAEGWDEYSADPEATFKALTAPGVTTLVAVEGESVAGAIQIQSDGVLQAHVSLLLIAPDGRGRGLGAALLREGLGRAGGDRLDIRTRTEGFYERLGASKSLGYRLTRDDLGL
jgi:ribosomal protein S18 acetylase RimI-like enzyme/predicted enzyme related to lactoylglutathione lyase